MFNIQVRLYKKDLTFSHTIKIDLCESQMNVFFEMLFEEQWDHLKDIYPTNVMVRENGKLISYKKFK